MKKRIFSRLMAMVMALALLSTSALAFEVNQKYVNGLTSKTDDLGNSYVELSENNEGDSNYILIEDINTNYTLRFNGKDTDATLDLNGFTIDHQGKEGSVIWVADEASLKIEDRSEEGTGTITGGTGINYYGEKKGGGIFIENRSSLTLNGGKISQNMSIQGGGIYSVGTVTINSGEISRNEAEEGGGIISVAGGDRVYLNGGKIFENKGAGITTKYAAEAYLNDGLIRCNTGGAVSGVEGGKIIKPQDSKTVIYENHPNSESEPAVAPTCTADGLTEGSHCSECGMVLVKQEVVPATGHTPGAPVRENEVAASAGMSGSYDEVIYCTECHEELSRSTRTIPALPMPVDFGDGFTGGAAGDTTITDETTPLAGIVTEAQLLDELYKHEGSPDVELVEKYAAHEYAPAISWALANAIVEDDEDFDPDEAVTVALLREVLTAYVEYKGIDFTVTVTGEDDEIVMDLSERLNVFFAQLEK